MAAWRNALAARASVVTIVTNVSAAHRARVPFVSGASCRWNHPVARFAFLFVLRQLLSRDDTMEKGKRSVA